MMRRAQIGILAFGLGFALTGAVRAGVEKPVELNEVPAKVMEVAKANFADLKLVKTNTVIIDDDSVIDDNLFVPYEILGDVTLISANTETEDDGSMVFEIQGTVEGGRKVEIDIDPNGNVVEIEIEFKVEDVPGAVLKAVEKKLPGFIPEFIEASHSRSMQVVGYEFVGKIGENKMDIEVSADGRSIVVSDQ